MNTTKETLARLLNGREYGSEISPKEEETARKCGLVVVFGASDDLIEFRGAFDDERDCYGGGEFLIDWEGVLPDRAAIDDDDDLERFFQRRKKAVKLRAISAQDDVTWVYETTVPVARFDIMEGGDHYCRGIVFERAHLPTTSVQ